MPIQDVQDLSDKCNSSVYFRVADYESLRYQAIRPVRTLCDNSVKLSDIVRHLKTLSDILRQSGLGNTYLFDSQVCASKWQLGDS